MMHFAWLDAKDLWLKSFEKRSADGKLLFRVQYSNPRKVGDVIWMPTKIEVYTSDGEKAGSTEYSDIKVNSDISDSLFE
jgi:outer membrane lipoprotein-sorting protein